MPRETQEAADRQQLSPFATRLGVALDRMGRRYRNHQFAADVSARVAPLGLSYTPSAITEWLKGRSEPRLRVVEAIADVLGVRPGWLAFGELPVQRVDDDPIPEAFRDLPRATRPDLARLATDADFEPDGGAQKEERPAASAAGRKRRPKGR